MSTTTDTIEGAIARSISHDEIVTVTVDDIDTAFAALTASTDDDYDYVDTALDRREVWSTDAADSWRVHLLVR